MTSSTRKRFKKSNKSRKPRAKKHSKNRITRRNKIHKQRGGQVSPLINAVLDGDLKTVMEMLPPGTDVNKADKDGRTPLYWASQYGHLEVVEALLAAEAEVDKADNWGSTPLHRASDRGDLEVVKALLAAEAEVNKTDNNGWLPLHEASWKGHVEVVKVLLAAEANKNANADGKTPLIMATRNGHLEVVKALLGAEADVNKASINDGWTPLYFASSRGKLEVVQALLGAEADVNKADKYGETPLFAASRKGHLDIVKALVDAGTDVNIRNIDDYSAVYYASRNLEKYNEIAKNKKIISLLMHTLVDKYYPKYKSIHARMDNVEEEWQRAVERKGAAQVGVVARSHPSTFNPNVSWTGDMEEGKDLPPDVIRVIQDYQGGKRKTKKSKAKKGSKKRITRRTRIKKGGMYDEDHDEYPDVKLSDRQYHINLLIGAIESEVTSFNDDDKKVERVQKIINNFRTKRAKEALVNTSLGYSANTKALHAAALRGDRFNGNMIKLLLNNGARVDSQDIWRQTPLHYAARRGPAINARILVEEGGADIGAKDRDGKTPLDIAKKEKNSSVERYLEGLLEKREEAKLSEEKEEAKLSEEKEEGMDDEQPTMKMDEIQRHSTQLITAIKSTVDYRFTMEIKLANIRRILKSLGTPANQKAGVNTMSESSQLPLHAAAFTLGGNGEMIRLLLAYGADVNARNNGETALHYAARRGSVINAKVLVEDGGADIDAKDRNGKTPLDIAREEGNSSVERYLDDLLKEREGRGFKGRFRSMIDNQRFESRFSSRSGRTYTEEKDDEKKDDNEFGYTPQPPRRRGGKRKTKKRSKKNKTSKSI